LANSHLTKPENSPMSEKSWSQMPQAKKLWFASDLSKLTNPDFRFDVYKPKNLHHRYLL
jgi:hypothetical protein